MVASQDSRSTRVGKLSSLVEIVCDENKRMEKLLSRIQPARQRGKFVLCLGATRTSDVPGISAAGLTPELRRLTPAVDSELVAFGRASVSGRTSVLTEEMVSPAVITRACAQMLGWQLHIFDCGVFVKPNVDLISVGHGAANCLSTGKAMSRSRVQNLLESGLAWGSRLARQCDYLIVSECVPGGTSTALALLTLLGYKCTGLVSGSVLDGNHRGKERLLQLGLASIGGKPIGIEDDPLWAVAKMGDPMQPFAAGMALSAARSVPVILAGGSQMLAVYALQKALLKTLPKASEPRALGVWTTKWVAADVRANSKELSKLVGAPMACAKLDFSKSHLPGLRNYENGQVKEGVGAGAALIATALAGFAESDILGAIENTFAQTNREPVAPGATASEQDHSLA
jgi:uncharacterized protein (TIGR00303 family)